MNAGPKIDYALAQVINGILGFAKAEDIEGFFASVNFITGNDFEPRGSVENIFDSYEEASGYDNNAVNFIDGLRYLCVGGSESEGIELIVESAKGLSADGLKKTLSLIDCCFEDKNIRRAVDLSDCFEEGPLMFSPHHVFEMIVSSPQLSNLEKLSLALKRKEPRKKAIRSTIFRQKPIDEKAKMKIVFAASMDNLAYQLSSFAYLGNGKRFNDFFVGLADYITPLEKNNLIADCFDEGRFDKYLDIYGFDGEERKRMQNLFVSFENFSAYRMPFLDSEVPERIIAELVNSIGEKIIITPQIAEKLPIYRMAPNIEELSIAVEEENDERGREIMKQFEPEFSAPSPYFIGLMFFPARDLVTQGNELVLARCAGCKGTLFKNEAADALYEYTKIFPFNEKEIIKRLTS